MAEMDLDNWDPMSSDYVDGSFNTYVEGPGAMLEHSMQPWARTNRSKGPFKLYVSNILPGITQEGLINIFCQFGEVLSAYKGERLPWALIEFRKHSEAVAAIHELNMKPPLFMKVQFARSETERQRVRAEREKVAVWKTVSESLAQSEPSLETPPRRKSGLGVGRGRLREVYVQEHFAPPYTNSGVLNGACLSDEETIGTPLGGRFIEANEALLKDIHCSLQSGGSNRIVSKGRGYYNVSHAGPGNRRQSQVRPSDIIYNSSEDSDTGDVDASRRTSGRYVYGDPVHMKPEVCGRCQNCGKVAHSGCARCGDFYCSENCLKIDWPMHKHNCIPPPGIVEISALNRSLGNKTMPHSSPLNIHRGESHQDFNEVKMSSKFDSKAAENNSPNVTGSKHMSSPNSVQNNNTSKNGGNKGSANQPSVKDLKLEELKLYDEEISKKKITPSLNFSDKSNQNTLHNRRNNNSQSEANAPPYQISTHIANNQKQNSKDDRSDAFSNADPGRSYNDQQNRSRSSYGHNEANKRNNGPNYGQTESNKRSHGQSEATKRNYGQTEGNERTVQNEGHRRKNDPRHGQYDENKRNNDGNNTHNDGSKRSYDGNFGKNDGHRKSNDGNRRSNDGNRRSKSQSRNSGHRSFSQRSAPEMAHQSGQQKAEFENSLQLSKEPKTLQESPSKSYDETVDEVSVAPHETKTEHSLTTMGKEELKADCFTKVKVCINVGKNECVVQKDETYEKLIENIQLLQSCKNSAAINPEVGKICAAPYEGVWYRAEIKTVSPEIKVYFLDFGNEEICTADLLRYIPETALSLPAQAIKIKFAPGTPDKYQDIPPDSELSVKPIKKDDSGTTVVVVEGEKFPTTEEKTLALNNEERQGTKELPVDNARALKLCSDGSVLDLLNSGMEGAMCIQAIENINQFTGTVVAVELLEKYRTISEELCANINDDSNSGMYEPTVGSLVAAELPSEGAWHRASVLSKVENGYRVAFVDLGFSQKVEKVKKLSDQLCGIENFSVRCRVTDYIMPRDDIWENFLKVGHNVKLVFDEVSPQKVTAKVRDNDILCVIEMTKWKPIPEDKGLQFLKLQNNSSAVLSYFSGSRTMFLKPTDKNLQESFNRILQDVAAHAFKAPPLGRLPVKGEIVACKYSSDGNFYRAKVTGFTKDKVIVTYLDFGNTEEEDPSNIKELTEDLKNVPPSVVKVLLKDVPDLPLNIQIIEYLSEINLKEQELKVKYDNPKDGVDLFLDGTHINAKLKSFLEPTWQQSKMEEKQGTPAFLYEHLRYVELPVGEIINMLICYAQPPNIVFGFKEGSDEMDYIMNDMESKINEYCTKVEINSFLPRKSEMCLAEYEGSWYRASCLEVINSEMVSVFFIDYGNTEHVSFKNIRKMPLDFMQIRVAVVACTVKGIPHDDTSKQDFVQQLLNSVKKVKVLKSVEKGHCEIEIVG